MVIELKLVLLKLVHVSANISIFFFAVKEAAKLGHEAFEVRIILFCILLF
jgi:hypothetical protein